MLIPLSTDRALRRPRLVTPALLAINLGVYGWQQAAALHTFGVSLEQLSGAQWHQLFAVWSLQPAHLTGWSLVTYAFLHAGWLHILGNMLFLWTFGANIEDKLGRLGFAVFYLLGAVASGLTHAALDQAPAVGASGAIAACTGAYLVMFPRTHIKCLCFFFYIGIVMVPAWWMIGGAITWDLLFRGAGPGGVRVAYLAHLGGYAYGAGLSLGLSWLFPSMREPWDIFNQLRQARRRAEIRSAVGAAEPRGPVASVPLDEKTERVAQRRAAIAEMLARDELVPAADEYTKLVRDHAGDGSPVVMGRRHQQQLANQLYLMGRHADAAGAYERFVENYRDDPEEPRARVMAALLGVRYLRDAALAQRMLQGLPERLGNPEQQQLARVLQEELAALTGASAPASLTAPTP